MLYNPTDDVKILTKENPHFQVVQIQTTEAVVTIESIESEENLDEKYPPTQGSETFLLNNNFKTF